MTTTLNFNDLSSSTIVDNEYQSQGVTISASGGSGQAMIFDTSNPTGGDSDLHTTNLGKALIISEDGDSNDPDDNGGGGTLSFTFDSATSVENLTFLDNEEGARVYFYDEHDNQIGSSVWVPSGSNNGQQVVDFNVDGAFRMDVCLNGSGAIDNLVFDSSTSGPDGIVSGTDENDDIKDGYTGDPDGDTIDNNDAIIAGEAPNDDIVYAGAGDDKVEAGLGDDEVYGGTGKDELKGEAGNDQLFGEDGDDKLFGGDGNDTLDGGDGNDRYLKGEDGDDVIFGGKGEDKLEGGKGADTLEGGEDADEIKGDYDRDVIIGATAGDKIDGGSGGDDYDTLDLSGAGPVNVVFTSSDNEDGYIELLDDNGNVTGTAEFKDIENVIGAISASKLDGIVQGTEGSDLIDTAYDGDPDGDCVDAGDAILPGEAPNDDIILAGAGNDTVLAGLGDDDVYAGSGDDLIFGQGGDDSIDGGTGDDQVNGGTGDDTIDGGIGNDTLQGAAGDDSIDGGVGNDSITGGGDDDTLNGGEGNDTLNGSSGNDSVDGGIGDDSIIGGLGSDTVNGGDGNDVIDTGGSNLVDKGYPGLFPGEEGTPGAEDDRDSVDGGAGDDTINTGDDADTITGGSGNDVIDGGIDDDSIFGDDGADRIVGGEGNDVIEGGAGDDTIHAGNDPDLGLDFLNIEDDGTNPFGPDLRPDNGDDTVFGGDGNDLITGADDDDVLYGDAGNDTIDGGIDDDSLFGGTGDDSLIGGQGNDTLSGDEGDDIIDGGIGNDDLSGGDDRDTFINVNAGDVVDGGEGGDDFDTLDLTGSAGPDQEINIVYDPTNNENGTVEYKDQDGNVVDTLVFTNIENVIPCFTPGTLIATAKGERRVEELVVGDRIITRDNGIQEVRWVGAREMTGSELEAAAHLKPILIQQGALGGGLPERDMMVSPQHRVLIANEKTALYFEEIEVLVAANFLTALDGVDVVDVSATTYIHIMFDQHEVVLSDGTWTESFQPGDQTLSGVGEASRDEILEIFPELATREGIDGYTSARRALKKHEAILLTT